DRDLGRDIPLRRRRPAPEQRQQDPPHLERHRRQRQAARLLGRQGPAGAARRLLRRAGGACRLLAPAQPHHAGVRGSRGRLQPGGRRLRRHQREAEPHPRDGYLGRVRGPGGGPRHARLPLSLRRLRHPDVDRRLPRHRRRAPRTEQRCRRRARRPAVRRPPVRDHARVDVHRHPAGAGRKPDLHDPGAGRPLRRRRCPHPLRLEHAPEAEAEGRGGMSALAERLPPLEVLRGPKAFGVAGITLGVFATFLAIPPIEARSVVWPILVGIVAASFGLWTATRGLRRLGWGAVAAGLIGIGLGILATRSSSGNLNTVFRADLIASMFVFSTPLVFASMGGMFSERSGVVNIGLEGMMLMGAFWGVYGADKAGSWAVGILVAMLAGGALALVHAFFAIHLRADQIVSGVAVNFLALGITGYFFFQLYHGQDVPLGISTIPRV